MSHLTTIVYLSIWDHRGFRVNKSLDNHALWLSTVRVFKYPLRPLFNGGGMLDTGISIDLPSDYLLSGTPLITMEIVYTPPSTDT